MRNTARPLRPLVPASLAVAALALPALTAGATPEPGTYAGKTEQHRRVSVKVSDDARRIRVFRISYRADCDDGSRITGRFRYTGLRVRKGRFAARARTKQMQDGAEVVQRTSVAGRFTAVDRVAGRWSARVTTTRADQTVVCTVKRLRWSAHS